MEDLRAKLQGFGEYVFQRYDVLKELADCCVELGRFAEAGTYYQQAITIVPRRLDAYIGLGLLAIRTGQIDIARSALGEATQLAPDNPEVLAAQAALAARTGDLHSAADLYERCLQAGGDNPAFAVGLFQCAVKTNQPHRAQPHLLDMHHRHPDDMSVGNSLALLYMGLRQYDLARQVLQDLLAFQADHPQTRALLAKVDALQPQPSATRSA